MTALPLPIRKVVLYKHGVGYFEREGDVEGDATLSLTFKQRDVSDVLKSLTVLDLDGGQITSVSYDATKPVAQLLTDVSFSIPDKDSLASLIPQLKGARVAIIHEDDVLADVPDFEEEDGDADEDDDDDEDEEAFDDSHHANGAITAEDVQDLDWEVAEGLVVGLDAIDRTSKDGIAKRQYLTIMTDRGDLQSFDLESVISLRILDDAVRQDLEFYLHTELSAKKKDARTFTFYAHGNGPRTLRLSYVLEAPVWKATYRILLGDDERPPMIQGWAVVDNTLDEDWEEVDLSLVSGLPVAFTHDLYTPRYLKRPEVKVAETTGVLPPVVEDGMETAALAELPTELLYQAAGSPPPPARARAVRAAYKSLADTSVPSSMPTQVRERKLGDLFSYDIDKPVTIRRNQSALVPIVLKEFKGRPVLLHNRDNRASNPMRCVEFENATGLTLEGGPATVLERGAYVGEAMLETLKPNEKRLIPFAVELSVRVLDNVKSFKERTRKVIIRDGMVRMQHATVQQTSYELDNKADQEYVLFLDHPRGGSGWKLTDTPTPVEVTENYWRFKLTLPPKQMTRFVVKQQMLNEAAQALGTLNADQLRVWIEQKYLDKKATQLLKDLTTRLQTFADLDRQMQRLEKERENIRAEQTRIRGNLDSLGDKPDEKELRKRYVRTLEGQEDRLEAIQKELSALEDKKVEMRKQMDDLIAKMEYEAEMAET